jgi:anti-anti-sigma regulatory factor
MCAVDWRSARPVGLDGTIVVVLGAPVSPGDACALCRRLELLLAGDGVHGVVCDVGALACPDLAAVGAVARLHLVARRRGHRLRLVHAARTLEELLVLVGLGDVVAVEETAR